MGRDLGADRTALLRLINGYRLSQALFAVASLGIPDALGDGSRTVEDLAEKTGTEVAALYRLLRAVAAAGVLEESEGQVFALTELGDGLRTDAPMSLGGWAAYIGRPYYWEAWAHLLDSVHSGDNAFRMVHGTDVWSYRSTRPQELEIFNRAMTSLSAAAAQAVVEAYDFGRFRRIVDVGGAQGGLLAAILSRHQGVEGVLFDQPSVVAGAPEVLAARGLAGRCQVVGGSFFDSVPEGCDAYLLKSVIHDWRDTEAAQILRTCGRAMGASAVLLIIEPILAGPNEGADAKLSDLNMLVAAGGQERTKEEWVNLLESAGLALQGLTPTRSNFSVIEAVKPSSQRP